MLFKECASVLTKDLDLKEKTIDGTDYGIIKGYASVYGNVDSYGDRVLDGAFTKTLENFKRRDDQIPLCLNHDLRNGTIGGCPVDQVLSDQKGLQFEGRINRKTSKGHDVYEFFKQGVYKSFSFAY